MLIGWLVVKIDLLINTQKGMKCGTVGSLNFNPFFLLFQYYFVVFYFIGSNKINILDGC
ncbi:hypothetical protein SAMN05444397_102327 [Flavobacterium aquidurense]|nr:hypothetical protein SAMN05444397_102327 [Flavobacterium aquidurense]